MHVYFFVFGIFSGCTPRAYGPNTSQYSYRTEPRAHQAGLVIVLPVYRGDDIGRTADVFTTALPSALREQGQHEVGSLSKEVHAEIFPTVPMALHDIKPDQLRMVRDHTGADSVVFTFIDQYQSYDPIYVGIRCYMVSCPDGATIWTASGHFDSGHVDVQKDMKYWYRQQRGEANSNLSGWRSACRAQRFSLAMFPIA